MAYLCLKKEFDLEREDVPLFSMGEWLNSRNIAFATCLLSIDYERNIDTETRENIHILDAHVVSWFRFCIEPEGYASYLSSNNTIHKKHWVLIPVNDCKSIFETGSHWSCLAYNIRKNYAIHFDSNHGGNNSAALHTLESIHKVLSTVTADTDTVTAAAAAMSSCPRCVHVPPSFCPQQSDGSSCGGFTLLFIDFVAKLLMQQTQTQSVTSEQSLDTYTGTEGDTPWLSSMRENVNTMKLASFYSTVQSEIANLVEEKEKEKEKKK